MNAPRSLFTSTTHPYTNPSNALQTLTIYKPTASLTSSTTQTRQFWLIYIHGGAWRDPLITSTTFEPTLTHLLSTPASPLYKNSPKPRDVITHYASLSYSLSPYPNHPTSPSNPADSSRNATHPQHLHDVVSALKFLRDECFAEDAQCVLVGHSCGATLAWQALLDHGNGVKGLDVKAVVSVAGLHDLPLLVREADPAWRSVYAEFLGGAFGGDEEVWRGVSPTAMLEGMGKGEGLEKLRLAVLAQSRADSLVGWGQVTSMRDVLREKWTGNSQVLVIEGEHDECWEKGVELAMVIEYVVSELAASDDE